MIFRKPKYCIIIAKAMRKNERRYPLGFISIVIRFSPLLFIIICFLLFRQCGQFTDKNQCENPVLSEMTWAKYKGLKSILFKSHGSPPCLTNKYTIKYIRNDFNDESAVWTENKKDVFRISSVTKMQCTNTGTGIIYIGNEVFEVTKNNRCTFEGALSNENSEVYEEYLKLKSKKPQCACEIPE